MSSKITLLNIVSKFFVFRGLQSASIKWSLRILSWTIHRKVIRYRIFNKPGITSMREVTFLLLVMEILIKYHKGNFSAWTLFQRII